MSRCQKNKALLFSTVCIGLLCLCQVACSLDGSTQEPEIDPDKFGVKLSDVTRKRNFVIVSITPGSSGMMLKDFFVTASLADNEGTVTGSSGRNGNNFVYGKELNNCNLDKLFLTSKKSNCLGANDTCFEQGKKVSFKIEAIPNTSIKEGDQYTLTVKIERKGSNPHTETKSTVLTAKQCGKIRKKKRRKKALQVQAPKQCPRP
jgi:hypothetical protein